MVCPMDANRSEHIILIDVRCFDHYHVQTPTKKYSYIASSVYV